MPGGVPQDATGDSTKGLRPRQTQHRLGFVL
jgi:hypothetical protein